jgi:integrase
MSSQSARKAISPHEFPEGQELLGHKTMTMTLRYAHPAEEHKKKAVSLLNRLTVPTSKTLVA